MTTMTSLGKDVMVRHYVGSEQRFTLFSVTSRHPDTDLLTVLARDLRRRGGYVFVIGQERAVCTGKLGRSGPLWFF